MKHEFVFLGIKLKGNGWFRTEDREEHKRQKRKLEAKGARYSIIAIRCYNYNSRHYNISHIRTSPSPFPTLYEPYFCTVVLFELAVASYPQNRLFSSPLLPNRVTGVVAVIASKHGNMGEEERSVRRKKFRSGARKRNDKEVLYSLHGIHSIVRRAIGTKQRNEIKKK